MPRKRYILLGLNGNIGGDQKPKKETCTPLNSLGLCSLRALSAHCRALTFVHLRALSVHLINGPDDQHVAVTNLSWLAA